MRRQCMAVLLPMEHSFVVLLPMEHSFVVLLPMEHSFVVLLPMEHSFVVLTCRPPCRWTAASTRRRPRPRQ
jgi:hypothetical protein